MMMLEPANDDLPPDEEIEDDLTPVQEIEAAIALLRVARRFLRRPKARKAAQAVNRAIKSTEGTLRHADSKELNKLLQELVREG